MKNILALLFLTILAFVLYIATIKGVHGPIDIHAIKENYTQTSRPFELSPERGRYLLTYSLAERNSFALDEELAKAATPDVGYFEGKYYIYFAPGISVLAMPMYNLGKLYNIPQVATFFTISLFAILNIQLIYLLARKLFHVPAIPAILAALIFAFGSTSWSYATTLYQHHVTTFFILSSFLSVWYFRHTHSKIVMFASSAYVWFAYGAGLFLDYPNMILLAPVVGYLCYSAIGEQHVKAKASKIPARSLTLNIIPIITSVIFIALISVHGYYNYIHFGSWSKLSGSLIGYDTLQSQKLLESKKSPTKQETQKINELANKKKISGFFVEESLPKGFAILTASRDRGLLVFSPIFILGILGILMIIKKITVDSFFLLSTIGVDLFLYGSWGDPWGGWAFGPRYLIPTMAILAVYIAIWIWKNADSWLMKILTLLMFMYSLGISLMGVLTTNQVPPKIEADALNLKYNFLMNVDYLFSNISSSYVYNTYLASHMTLVDYYIVIYEVIACIFLVLLLCMPRKQSSQS